MIDMKQIVKVFTNYMIVDPIDSASTVPKSTNRIECEIQDFLDKHPCYSITHVSANEKNVIIVFEDKTDEIRSTKKTLCEEI